MLDRWSDGQADGQAYRRGQLLTEDGGDLVRGTGHDERGHVGVELLRDADIRIPKPVGDVLQGHAPLAHPGSQQVPEVVDGEVANPAPVEHLLPRPQGVPDVDSPLPQAAKVVAGLELSPEFEPHGPTVGRRYSFLRPGRHGRRVNASTWRGRTTLKSAVVGGANGADVKAFGDRDNTGVDQTEMEILVGGEEYGAALVIHFREVLDGEVTGSHGRDERLLCPVTETAPDEQGRFRDHRGGDDQFSSGASVEESRAGVVVVISTIGGRVEHARVDDDHTSRAVLSAKCSRRISS